MCREKHAHLRIRERIQTCVVNRYGVHLVLHRPTSITLGVLDLGVASDFYVYGMGFVRSEFHGVEHPLGLAHFFLFDDLRLGLWPLSSMSIDTGQELDSALGSTVLGLSVASRADVHTTFERALARGGSPLAAPRSNFWGGFSAYITDPDSHIWEIVFDPGVLNNA